MEKGFEVLVAELCLPEKDFVPAAAVVVAAAAGRIYSYVEEMAICLRLDPADLESVVRVPPGPVLWRTPHFC